MPPVPARQRMCDSWTMSQTLTLPAPPPVADDVLDTDVTNGELLVEESLVEEVSIDGMCGVY